MNDNLTDAEMHLVDELRRSTDMSLAFARRLVRALRMVVREQLESEWRALTKDKE